MEVSLLSWIMIVCTVGMLVVLMLPAGADRPIKIVSAVCALLTVVLSLVLWMGYDRAAGGLQYQEARAWLPDVGLKYHVAVDGFGVVLVTLTAVVFFTGVLSMWDLAVRVKEYFALMILLVIGVFGVFIAQDLFLFFFMYEVAVLPMYLLIAIWGSGPKEYAAMKLMLFLMGGSALLFPGLIALYWGGGAVTWQIPELAEIGYSFELQRFVYPFIYIGFGVLAGMFPFHGWSPSGHSAAPTAVSMLHAGVLMKLGAFGILTIGMRLLPEGAAHWAPFFAALATVNIVYGAFVAMRQPDIKFVIGFSSVSHMGIVLLGLNLALMGVEPEMALNGAVFQMFSHGIMTALFFSTVGFFYEQTHTKLIDEMGGFSRVIPRASVLFILAGMCGAGVPLLSSFWAELLVFIAALRTHPVIGVLVITGLIQTALYILRVINTAFFGKPPERWETLRDMDGWHLLPRVILAGILLLFGLMPMLILDLIDGATAQFLVGM